MDLTDDQQLIRDSVLKLCARFDDGYWLARDRDGEYPRDFAAAFAEGGWIGTAMPAEYGGAGLGVTEAALAMQAVAESGAGMSGASAVHISIFGPRVIVKHGTAEQKRRFLAPLIAGKDICSFGVTEPDAGLDTTHIKTFAERSGDRYVIRGQKVWTSLAQVATRILLENENGHVTGFRIKPAENGEVCFDIHYRNGGSSKLRSLREWSAPSWPRSSSSAAMPIFRCSPTARR